jgi:hypothetical protein
MVAILETWMLNALLWLANKILICDVSPILSIFRPHTFVGCFENITRFCP